MDVIHVFIEISKAEYSEHGAYIGHVVSEIDLGHFFNTEGGGKAVYNALKTLRRKKIICYDAESRTLIKKMLSRRDWRRSIWVIAENLKADINSSVLMSTCKVDPDDVDSYINLADVKTTNVNDAREYEDERIIPDSYSNEFTRWEI